MLKENINKNKEAEFSIYPPFPQTIMVEVTNRCNAGCVFCYNQQAKRKRGNVDVQLMERLLPAAYNLGAKKLGLYTTGEPLLSSDIAYFVILAKCAGYEYVYVTTNGISASKDKVDSLLNAGLDSIKFSINAGTPQSYVTTHKVDRFDEVIGNVKTTRELINEGDYKCKVYVSCVTNDVDDFNKLKHLVNDYVDEIVMLPIGSQGGYMTEYPQLCSLPCPMVFNRIHITYEGYVTACCVDYENDLIMGDYNKDSLKSIWNGKPYTDLRKRHLTKTGSCETCKSKI